MGLLAVNLKFGEKNNKRRSLESGSHPLLSRGSAGLKKNAGLLSPIVTMFRAFTGGASKKKGMQKRNTLHFSLE